MRYVAATVTSALLGLAAGTAMLDPADPATAGTGADLVPAGHVTLSTVITGFRVSLDESGQLSYSGCLGLPSSVTSKIPARVPGLVIQYAAERGGTWQRLGSAALTGHGCGNQGEAFAGSLAVKLTVAYYQAFFPGGAGMEGTRYAAAHSQALLAWKFADRITSFAVWPRTAAAGHALTVRGILQYYHSGWHGYGGQQVLVIFRRPGTGDWYYIAQPTTGPTGAFSATFTGPGSATWAAEYLGDSAHLAAVSPMT
jgi:hypothetical protein